MGRLSSPSSSFSSCRRPAPMLGESRVDLDLFLAPDDPDEECDFPLFRMTVGARRVSEECTRDMGRDPGAAPTYALDRDDSKLFLISDAGTEEGRSFDV